MNILEYENYKEKTKHGDAWFPYITYPCSIPLDFPSVPLHWHEEMEIIYVKKGTGIIHVDFKQYVADTGAIALIIPGQLHSIEQYQDISMEYENIIFHPNILLTKQTDACSSDFFLPLLAGTISVPVLYTPELPVYPLLASCLDKNDKASENRRRGYQLLIKSQLFFFFSVLDELFCRDTPRRSDQNSLEKMKLILKYIENHYMDKITISDIAKEINLSESHFMKYFKKTMGTSFIAYLNDYRLTMTQRLLLSSDDSILDIAAETGFENLSYFNRIFKKRFGQTPSEYRKKSKPASP